MEIFKVASREYLAHIDDHQGFSISPLPMYASTKKPLATHWTKRPGVWIDKDRIIGFRSAGYQP
ncbi:MAG: hypothetical protein U5R30_15160 [Deltaproteobacteria bacterium]|nr:hypothetical protein [Deltaproteobacteria bacterium]